MDYVEINELVNKVFTSVKQNGDEISFLNENESYKMKHRRECCESVYIDSIVGDLSDLENTPILVAEERTNSENPKRNCNYADESFTWTFYTLRTIKGSVDIRWYGRSNGYYSESVDIIKYTSKI